jgi:V/A-type H+-transporting ATPase subunit D
MELSRVKKRLKVSSEAHKLLKDKQDELVRRFIALLKETHDIRKQVNASLIILSAQAGLSAAAFPYKMAESMYLSKETLISAQISEKNWMGVTIADIEYDVKTAKPSGALISNPMLMKTGRDMRELLPQLLRLTIAEKNCQMLSDEIESLRRRVNALEHMIIPNLVKTIRIIKMKLSDNERDTITRLIKVKNTN